MEACRSRDVVVMALIESANPKVINRTFDLWWLDGIDGRTTFRSTPQQSFSIVFTFVRGSKTGDIWTLSEDPDDVKRLSIPDAFAFAQEQAMQGNMQPAELLGGIIGVSAAVAKQQGVID